MKCRNPRRKNCYDDRAEIRSDEAVNITVDDVATLRVKMIDCGAILHEALGTIETVSR